MTERNKVLRDKIRTIETLATNCLHTQPEEDDSCEVHLALALAKIAETSADYLGASIVDAYDIVWDTDGNDPKALGLPESVRLSVAPCDVANLGEQIADMLSDRSGWRVKSCKYRMM